MLRRFMVLLLIFTTNHLFAQDTGKLTGFISDKESNEPVSNAKIILENFPITGLTDLSGQYFIDNIPAGTYTIRIKSDNYATFIKNNVKIDFGKMAIIDFELTEYLKTFIDEAEISSDISNAKFGTSTIGSEQLSILPMDEFADVFPLWPGIAPISNSFTFLGSRPFQPDVHYYLDGVDITNLMGRPINMGGYSDNLLFDIPEGAFKNMKIFTGNYSAEFGNSLAGVVEINTKSDAKKISAFFSQKRTVSEFGFQEDYLKPNGFYTDQQVINEARFCGTGARENNNFYYKSPSRMHLNPAYDRYQFGVNVPIILNRNNKNNILIFGFYGDILKKNGFFRGQKTERQTYLGKLKYQHTQNLSFDLSYLTYGAEVRKYNHRFSRLVTTGDTLWANLQGNNESSPILVGSIVAGNGEITPVKDYDMQDNQNRPAYKSNLFSISLNYRINGNLKLIAQYSKISTNEKYRSYDPWSGKELLIDDFREIRFSNPTASNFFPPGAPTAQTLESYWYIQPMVVEKWKQDVEQSIDNFKIKTLYQFDNIYFQFGGDYSAYNSRRNYYEFAQGGNEYNYLLDFRPSRYAVFINSEFKIGSVNINAGLRYETIKPQLSTNLDDYFFDYEIKKEDLNYLSVNLRVILPEFEKNIFYFDYAKYATHPVFEQYFTTSIKIHSFYPQDYTTNVERVDYYSLNLKSDFIDYFHLKISGYIRQYSNLQSFNNSQYFSGPPINSNALPAVVAADNDVKGFHFSLSSDRIYNTSLLLNFTNQSNILTSFKYANYTNRDVIYEKVVAGWNISEIVTLAIDYQLGKNKGPEIFGFKPFANSGLYYLRKYYSGRPFTSRTSIPPPNQLPINDARFPSFYQIDIKLYKYFNIWQSIKAGIFIEIFNYTNNRILLDIYNTEQYKLGVDEGDGTWNDPSYFSPPREVRFGFEVSF